MHIVTQNLFWLCTTVLVGGNVICNLFWSHTSLPITFLAMHTIRHNFFWLLITIHAQTFFITYIVTHHILAYAHCYTQLFSLGTMLFTIFWLHTSLHTTFFTTHIYHCTHLFCCCAQRYAQHFLWLPTPSRTTFIGYAHCHTQFFVMHNIMHNTLLVTHIS